FNNAEIVIDQKSVNCAILISVSGLNIGVLKSLTFQENSPNKVPIDIDASSINTITTQELNLSVSDFNTAGGTLNIKATNLNFLKPVNFNITNIVNLEVDKINE